MPCPVRGPEHERDSGSGATIGEHVGDLTELLAEERRRRLPRYELPEERSVVTFDAVAERLTEANRVDVTGVHGSAAALAARAVVRSGRRVLFVTSDADTAQRARDDLRFMLGQGATVLSLSHNDVSPYADMNPDRRAAQLRLATLAHLSRGLPFDAIVVPIGALSRHVVPRDVLEAFSELVQVDQELDRDTFVSRLAEAGYARGPLVEDPGTFAVRGSLVDVWSPSAERPVRIELFGDGVMSIKEFDSETQRTLGEVREAFFCPAREIPMSREAVARARERVRALCDAIDMPSNKARLLVEDVASGRAFFGADGFMPAFVDPAPLSEYLRGDLVVLLEDPPSLTRALREELDRAREDDANKTQSVRFPLASFYRDEADVARDLASRKVLGLHRAASVGEPIGGSADLGSFELAPEDAPTVFTFDQSDVERAVHDKRSAGKTQALEPLEDRLRHWSELGFSVGIVARTQTQLDRIVQLLAHRGIVVEPGAADAVERLLEHAPEPRAMVVQGSLCRGVVAPLASAVFLTEEEIFGARAARRVRRADGASKTKSSRAFVEDLKSLSIGDYVVHVEHGIGRYLGLVHRDVGATRVDLLVVEYAGGDKLYLPVYRLNQIQKYAGGEGAPKMDRLGGQTFAKTKARAEREVRQMADQLLRIYAERRAVTREPLPSPDDEYRAFEATFPFDETADQARAIGDVERDLEMPSPMDRLVCGDVGFGKTEIAIRAAFRVASQGRQVAILCPTTVLAYQHYLGFSARMREYPLVVKGLSRFSSKAEQDEVIRGLKAGTVDVVIGTHRLLSKDVHFKKLGLVVVDEEQRFGVGHKERMKQLKTSVDVLTLTATPIPRTLQMAISGIRDMSVITTPPVDRRAIRTLVTRWDANVLRDAVERELDRGGQIFFVYNRVEGLHERAARLQELVPRARIAVAHGKMSETALERSMLDFVEGRYDVLCATAIVESGLDIPRANTMIIDRADIFGLAQLYQLRGRVGRSKERAYCFLVTPPQNEMSDEARSRIEAIERHTELGSGFHVASLDLELRGGGDLLGAEQSGTIGSIGFELFCQMLDQAVHELRGEPVVHDIDPELSVDEEALLPDDYIEDVGVRLSLYKRLASADGEGEVDEIAVEMEDRFGPPPDAAKRLIRLMRLKTDLRRLRALGCEATSRGVTIHLAEDTPLEIPKVLALVQAKKSPYKITPDMRITRRISEAEAVKGGLDAADLVIGELARCAKAA
ncbi:MAG: transcription-repair coupling factor [Polyangiaceae bacterium]|nr:transcription-repair coupling factor [Polyangiaceae bacterium]